MSNRHQFGCIENTWEHTGTPGKAQERTGAQRKDLIMYDKGHCKLPINARTIMHLPSAVVVAAALFSVLSLRKLFE